MIQRADSKRSGAGNTSISHGPAAGNGTRHRRLTSSRFKHARANGTFLRRLMSFVGLGSMGLVAMIMVYTVSRLDARRRSAFSVGFSYKEGGLRGDKGAAADQWQQLQKPLPQPFPAPPPPPPPAPLPLEEDGGAVDANGPVVAVEDYDGEKNKDRNRGKRPKKRFQRAPNAKILERGGWKGGGGEGIDTDVGDSSWGNEVTTGAPSSNAVGYAAAAALSVGDEFLTRAVIVDADKSDGDVLRGASGQQQQQQAAAKPQSGQLQDLAELHEDILDQEGSEEWTTVQTTPMLGADAALLIICANRPEYLKRALDAVAEYHPGSSRGTGYSIPVVISQDGSSQQVEDVISQFKDSMAGRAHVIHIRHTPPPRETRPYFKLSAHYKWALSQVFDELDLDSYDSASKDKTIILEEDLEIAPDFFEYFSATAPLLDSDETLMAVSAWNDNGQADHVKNNEALFRSDFFPGLGWMLPRRLWDELAPEWPEAYWDDWLREPERRKERQFIRPEVCRTYHFGQKGGASNNQFADPLSSIRLNTIAVPFREMDLSYLEPDTFRDWLGSVLRDAATESIENVTAGRSHSPTVVVEYGSEREFERLAGRLGIMKDTKAAIPRTAYAGVVPIWVGDTKVFLAPKGGVRTADDPRNPLSHK
ncbi:unnamed protein product [Pylaiella littoralis]